MKTKNMVGLGLLTAMVVVLQILAAGIRLGVFSISLVLVPIVVGAALYGWKGGGWLGFAFGLTVLLNGDAALFMSVDLLGAILVVLVKGVACGLLAGLAYHLLEARNKTLAVILAAVICPVTNTGIFLLGCRLFFMDTISQWAAAAGYASAGTYMILGLAGVNFLVELAVNMVLSPTITRLIQIGKR